ncbi:MAG: amidohydrolase family protein, partial [Lapillicoccus sp.]
EASLYDFAAAGTDCIEHACGLQPETIASFAAQGIAIVPTLVNIANLPALAEPGREKFPAYYAHMMDLHRRRYDTIGAAHHAGIAIYLGTDAGGGLGHGLVAQEAAELAAAGLSPIEVLGAATWSARKWLGRPGVEEGASADLVVYESDPRADLGVLAAPSAVVLRGQTV